jgi:hypothetical protein
MAVTHHYALVWSDDAVGGGKAVYSILAEVLVVGYGELGLNDGLAVMAEARVKQQRLSLAEEVSR